MIPQRKFNLQLKSTVDFLALAATFSLAVYMAKIHAGIFPAPLLPELSELLLLILLGAAWHVTSRALGLYNPSRSYSITRELAALGKNTLVQFIGLAAVLFFLKTQTLNRYFVLLYSAGLLASALAMRLIMRACARARRLPMKYLLPATGAVVLVFASLFFIFSPAKPPRPNIILISIDTLRADRLGCYGCPTGTSPNIDAFSRESVQFTQAVSQAPSTTASHMSLFTGMLPPVHRVTNWVLREDLAKAYNLSFLTGGIPTLAEYLKKNGYATVGLHNGRHVSSFFGFDRGFDVYTDKMIDWENLNGDYSALENIHSQVRRSIEQKKPFFLFLHHYLCHDPYLSAPRQIREYFLPDPEPGLPFGRSEIPGPDAANSEKRGTADDDDRRDETDERESFWKHIDGGNSRHRRHVRALYDSCVNYSDLVFGKIIELLKRKGLYDRSLLAVISDHGEEFWEHGGTLHRNLFTEILHVPLLVRFPGGKYGGRKVRGLVGLFDLMPTILEYLRITPGVKPQARSLLPLVQEERMAQGRVLSFDDGLQFVRFNRGPFSYSNQCISDVPGEWLYNRNADRRERHNLAATNERMILRMRAMAVEIMKDMKALRTRIKAGASGSRQLPEELKKQLRTLGYL